jgi:Flp pilus assembly secretin CpaC
LIVKRKRAGEDRKTTEITAGGSTIVSETVPLRVRDTASDVRATADESGALRKTTGQNAGDSALLGVFSAGGQSSVGGTDFNTLINNQLETNIARAKTIELAEGRIISFLVVDDLPQVRVDIKLYELNRTALLDWDSTLNKAGVADFDTNGINPNNVSRQSDGSILTNANGEAVLGSRNTDIANVINFLEGGFGNSFKVGGGHFAIDAAFRLLETQGIARAIASPSLTVLSGELAACGDGGSVSVRSSITTNVGINDSVGVFSSVQKLSFGVQLAVRPLVDENGWITLDVVPSVSNPDFELTQLVRTTTGTPQETIAFAERSMRTSARLRDGDTLLIGGLQDRSRKDKMTDTPGLSKIPLIGWLFHDKSFEDKDRELVISVNPSIVREPLKEARLWAYPSANELMPRAPRKQEPRSEPARPTDAQQGAK